MDAAKQALVKAFADKAAQLDDEVLEEVYQSVADRIAKEDADSVCKHFSVTSADDVQRLVGDVSICWYQGDMIETRQQFVATAKACKYASKWCIQFDEKQSVLDSLTAEDWGIAFDAVADSTPCAFLP